MRMKGGFEYQIELFADGNKGDIREILQTQDTEMEIFYSLLIRTGYLLTEMWKLFVSGSCVAESLYLEKDISARA